MLLCGKKNTQSHKEKLRERICKNVRNIDVRKLIIMEKEVNQLNIRHQQTEIGIGPYSKKSTPFSKTKKEGPWTHG